MNPVFEKLAAVHLREVLEIETVSFPHPWTRALFEREINFSLSHFFVMLIEGRIAGYGGYWQVLDEGHIVSLAVHPGYRRQGLGRAALQFLIDEMKQYAIVKILLEVRRSNVGAQRLYASYGFVVNGVRPQYYQDEDAVLMERILT